MATERTRTILDDYLRVLLERGSYAAFFHDDVTFTLMGSGQQVSGRDAVEQFIRYLHEQAFDAQPRVRTVFAEGDRAVLEADFVGTHHGDFMGLPATGKQVEVPYAVVYDLAGDKITALRAYMPMDVLMRQLNAAPVAQQAVA